MSPHTHLSDDEICERALSPQESDAFASVSDCELCTGEIRAFAQVLFQVRKADAALSATTDWDDLLIRSRIRAAVAQEAPHRPSFFGRLSPFRPAFVTALVAALALAVWSPLSVRDDREVDARMASLAASNTERIPAWTPLPDEADDEGLAVLAEWTPNEDELTVARCRAACLSGLSAHEENLLLAVSGPSSARSPLTEPSPL